MSLCIRPFCSTFARQWRTNSHMPVTCFKRSHTFQEKLTTHYMKRCSLSSTVSSAKALWNNSNRWTLLTSWIRFASRSALTIGARLLIRVYLLRIFISKKTCEQPEQDYRVRALCFRLLGSIVSRYPVIFQRLQTTYPTTLDHIMEGLQSEEPAMRCASLEICRNFLSSEPAVDW